ncbi:hypothetical protein HH_0724 [Helicobacter hepaticus ATCC 51449]|uniref:Uncharacterized protein n=1 Tax=Helicobacter hepaticus (strain ATCC 51449 / 3B1) TaxID=235279 RepID=Q7VI84_HELHP|nr:hypothetical protein HH_0724 [Helicobacter hepaticus ATCC 51449]
MNILAYRFYFIIYVKYIVFSICWYFLKKSFILIT